MVGLKEKDYVNFEKLTQKINQYANVSIKNKEASKKWLAIAREDIEVCNLLVNNKYYSASSYYLEQAYEKLLKSFYLLSGKEDEDSIFGHDFVLKILKKEVTKKDDLKQFFELVNTLEGKNYSLDGYGVKIDDLKQDEDALRRMSKKEIIGLLELIEKLGKSIKSKESINKLCKKIGGRKSKRFLHQMLLRIIGGGVRKIPLEDYIGEGSLIRSIDYILISMKLHVLSLVTFPHWNTPRYPISRGTEMGFFDYTEELGVVKSTKELVKVFYEIVDSIEKSE